MNKWIIGARVKTLPAAVSPVLIGTFYALEVNWLNALLALIVSLSLQIAVNYANDYSDGIRGTDTDRVGPIRLVASGLASAKSVKRASYISFLFAVIAGSLLSFNISLWLIPVGGICILAAWGYTGGKQPYGYLGFGEFSVFIFFGLVATVGSYYVQSEQLNWQILLLSVPVITAQLAALSAIGIDQLVALTLVCLPFTYQVVKQVLGGAKDAVLITVLNNTARLQLLMSALIATALYI